ncbi:MAG: LLM class F420-dependent oxidoreductase [Streptosporangiales bacterium]|jgi:alkanesulfonate monooxygenase|nr:LLM class F420-dependent oxidoreductase [Streptosporangiales bacterium]
MDIGLHIAKFNWPGAPGSIAPALARAAAAADEAGFSMLSVMDHLWQLDWMGDPSEEMLEAYTTLGYLAAHTKRIPLLAFVTAVTYREPGLLAKAVTTLDVLSGGRAWLGIGAGFYEAETTGLGLPLHPTAERFERLEEALAIMNQMWSDSEEPFAGRHYQLGRTLNSPQPLTRPRPPILIAGGGEKKTLRLVAQYADACNIPGNADVARKLSVLRQHCDDVGRDYDSIKKTVIGRLDPGPRGEKADEVLGELAGLAKLGVNHVQTQVIGVQDVTPLEVFAETIIPEAAKL